MINLSKTSFPLHLKKKTAQLEQAFLSHLDKNVTLPADLKYYIFPDNFFGSAFYLLYPSLFRRIFKDRNNRFTHQLCISGFLYFKYLLCMDAINDKDDPDAGPGESHTITLLKSHTYQNEALKILAGIFGNNQVFWECWSSRNNEFLSSILMDAAYNLQMSFDAYKKLSVCKCSISKVAIDAYYAKHQEEKELYAALLLSVDHFSIARCIQDDLEDFKKDFIYRKNNLGHMLLNKWFKERGMKFEDHTSEVLEKYFFTSETAERLMQLSRDYYQEAINAVAPYREQLGDYIRVLTIGRNSMNFYKVNTHAYRINTHIRKVTLPSPRRKIAATEEVIAHSLHYLDRLQNKDGSWYEISNMQGLSNVWSTGFIASFLEAGEERLHKAADFLLNNKQQHLWGYNSDWQADYDSSTAALITLSKTQHNVRKYLELWFGGQTAQGGFSTYAENDPVLADMMDIRPAQLKGWTGSHACVSALAYYLLSQLPDKHLYQPRIDRLRQYLLSSQNRYGVWHPYWWTSYLYPTCFIIQSILSDSRELLPSAERGLAYIISRQGANGSYSCEVLFRESVFYTSLVLDTVCSSPQWADKYKREAMKMKKWIVSKQYEDGAFPGSDFLVIPNPGVTSWHKKKNNFLVNSAGGGNSITGEVASLFSTAVTVRALRRFSKCFV